MKNEIQRGVYAGAASKVKLIAILAILSAASVVLGKFLQIPIGDSIRISFENLPLIFAGIVFGPVAGAAVGTVADLIGCLAVGYTINPIITLGAAMVGFISGTAAKLMLRDENHSMWRILLSVFLAHLIGSILIKSIGLRLAYTTAWSVLAVRIPVYLSNTVVETLIIAVLLKSGAIKSTIRRFFK